MLRNLYVLHVFLKNSSSSKWLALAKWWYNANFHSSLKMTPFQALYGCCPPQLLIMVDSNGRLVYLKLPHIIGIKGTTIQSKASVPNAGQPISRMQAEALVADTDTFMTSTFYFRGNADEEPGRWMPVSLVRKEQGFEYSISFDECDASIPQSKGELIDLLEQSSKTEF